VSDSRGRASERPGDDRQEQGCAQEQLEKPITHRVSPPLFRCVVDQHKKRGTRAQNVSLYAVNGNKKEGQALSIKLLSIVLR
jgi:hypothetical protein